jgi:hypothetical protein
MSMSTQRAAELVADPVGHISISGVHGRDELNERLANARDHTDVPQSSVRTLLLGAAIGAVIMYALKR